MIIDDFLARYEREYDYYLEVARLCQQRCEMLLLQKGIRAIVTSRAKKRERLQQKVRQRASQKKSDNEETYKSIDDIYHDIVDLAGVRIALYFPGNIEDVEELIKNEFTLKEDPIIFPAAESERHDKKKNFSYNKRFTGYGARHYRVYLKKENIVDQRYSKSCIEIQVASVLMHAWAEVEHDLLYKPLSGELSLGEHAILDEINGLILTGEIALERLQYAQEVRLGKDDTLFNDQYELAIFLHNHFRTQVNDPNMIIGRADILFRFLQLTDLNRPEELRKYTSKLNNNDENETTLISDQLLDIILGTDENLYKAYEKALFEVNARGVNSSSEAALGYFLTRWIELETVLKFLLERQGIRSSKPTMSYMDIKKYIPFFSENPENFQELDRLRRLRNDVVHRAEITDIATLNQAIQSLEHLLIEIELKNGNSDYIQD